MNRTLNVFFSVDKNYIVHFTVTLTSLLENNRDLEVKVFVVHDLEDASILDEVVKYFKSKFNVELHLRILDNKIFENFRISNYISKATYFRLLFAEILPEDVSFGLSLDCDTIVTGSLAELANLSFINENRTGEYYLLAVSDKSESTEIKRLSKMGFVTTMYFNAGVMLVNIAKWRSDRVSDSLIKIAEKYKEDLTWHDQDVLNIHFRNNCGKLDATYNKFVDTVLPEMPLIIHFSGSSKPWHYLNNHPYKSQYWKYLKMTPFKNAKFEKITVKKILKKYYYKFKNPG